MIISLFELPFSLVVTYLEIEGALALYVLLYPLTRRNAAARASQEVGLDNYGNSQRM